MNNNSIVLTGFGPFGKCKFNISAEIVKGFTLKIQGTPIVKKILRVNWKRSIKEYISLHDNLDYKPLLVVLLGIHSHVNFHIEKYGWNFRFGQDIDKNFKCGLIKRNLSLKIQTILDVRKIYSALRDQSNVSISVLPGFYLCNFIYYSALFLSNQEYPVLFIHVPENESLSEGIRIVELIIKSIMKIYYKKNLQV